MLKNSVVKSLIEKGLEERPDLFLIDFTISADNKINVILDGDNGVSVEDCIFISRAVEHNLDREEEDFALEVASAGATSPLVNKNSTKKISGEFLK